MKKNRTIVEWLEDRSLAMYTSKAKNSVEQATSSFTSAMHQLQQAEADNNTSADELQRQAKAIVEAAAICRAEADKAGRVGRRIKELMEG